jgi:hypothetical protein
MELSIPPSPPLYVPLSTSPCSIRILHLQASESEDSPVQGTLQAINLDPQPSRSYITLSYAWGDGPITKGIIINGITLPVTTNLASASRHLRAVVYWQSVHIGCLPLRVALPFYISATWRQTLAVLVKQV